MNLKEDKELINKILFNYPNNYWNWYIKVKHNKKIKFKEYIQSIRNLKHIEKKYNLIYKWIHRRLFINKSIKLLEYYYRPYNEGYYLTLNHFNDLMNKKS